MYQLAILSLPGLKTSIFSEESPLKGLMNSLTWTLWNFTTKFWHLSLPKIQKQDPKCPIISICLRPRLKIPQRFCLLCCSAILTYSPSMDGNWQRKGMNCLFLQNGCSCSPSRSTSKGAPVSILLPARPSQWLVTDSWYFLSGLHEFCPSKQQPVLFYDVL